MKTISQFAPGSIVELLIETDRGYECSNKYRKVSDIQPDNETIITFEVFMVNGRECRGSRKAKKTNINHPCRLVSFRPTRRLARATA